MQPLQQVAEADARFRGDRPDRGRGRVARGRGPRYLPSLLFCVAPAAGTFAFDVPRLRPLHRRSAAKITSLPKPVACESHSAQAAICLVRFRKQRCTYKLQFAHKSRSKCL